METTERKATPDCIPDVLRQIAETAARASDDTWFQTRVLKQAMAALVEVDFDRSAAELVFESLAAVHNLLGKGDPYAEAKKDANDAMLALLPELRTLSGSGSVPPSGADPAAGTAGASAAETRRADPTGGDPVAGAIRLAAAATALPFPLSEGKQPLRHQIAEQVNRAPALDDAANLHEALKGAKQVLFLLDRAGEIVADRVLVEAIVNGGPASGKEVTCVVRRSPILGCATAEDAAAVGLDSLAKVVDPGAEMLGLVLNLASKRFNETLATADVVVAKGVEHFQTLAGAEREIFFLLSPRSEADAQYLRVPPGSPVVCHHEPAKVTARRKQEV